MEPRMEPVVDNIWMAEVGENGWSAVRSTYEQAVEAGVERWRYLYMMGYVVPKLWIYRNGELYIQLPQ